MPINDNDQAMPASLSSPDPHGQAALLLVESLIHGLCEKGVLDANEAVVIAERAVSVQFDVAEAADGAGAPMWRSHSLLASIATSLKADSEDGRPNL